MRASCFHLVATGSVRTGCLHLVAIADVDQLVHLDLTQIYTTQTTNVNIFSPNQHSGFLLLSLMYTFCTCSAESRGKRHASLTEYEHLSVVWSCRCKSDVLMPYTLQMRSQDIVSSQTQRRLQYSCHERCEQWVHVLAGFARLYMQCDKLKQAGARQK